MADKIVTLVKKGRADVWEAFKKGISITGYKYYQPPPAIKYRYPAPGSCALDVEDHPNLYKNDWKTPFRMSEYNIQKQEWSERWDDPAVAERLISKMPYFNPEDRLSGKYDKIALLQQQPSRNNHKEIYSESVDLFGE
jgi:hypothetical protein